MQVEVLSCRRDRSYGVGMSKKNKNILVALLGALLLPVAAGAQVPGTNEWLSFGYDQQRSGWNSAETTLSPANVGRLKLLWSSQLPTPPQDTALSTLTAPLVAQVDGKTLVFTIGIDDTLFAIDADSGKIVWQKSFPNTLKPVRQATTNCANTEQATPVIDKKKGVIYFTTSDGKLRGASLADGAEKLMPMRLCGAVQPQLEPQSRQ